MRSPRRFAVVFVSVALILSVSPVALAQYDISTVAGGGPNGLAALSASIGYPGSVAIDSAGNTYIADSYSSDVLKVDASGNVTVVAGNGTFGYSGDGGPATSAVLSGPEAVFVDGSGNIFIADTNNSVIREIAAATGNISTVAGNGTGGYNGDGISATSAELYDPNGVFVDGSGNIFIADTDNCLVRKVSGGNISTVAGNYALGCGYGGDGATASGAQLDQPEGVSVDSTGNIFIADTYNSVIREVTVADNNIHTVAGVYYDFETNQDTCTYSGDGAAAVNAYLCLPAGVFVDGSENIFIADTSNFVIREFVTGGNIATVAGDNALGAGYSGDGGAAISAQLNNPNGIFVDGTGDIFIADNGNYVIREVTSNDNIGTVIGNNFLAYGGDGASAVDAQLNGPGAVFVDALDDIFIADAGNSVIREVVAATGDIQTVAGNGVACANPAAVSGACGDGGSATGTTGAQLNSPYGVFLNAVGDIFIADSEDHRIRVVNTGATAITVATIVIPANDIATVAGNGTPGYSGDTGAATSAELFEPWAVFADLAGNIFIADTANNVIREVAAATGLITTVAGTGVECAAPTATCGDGGVATSAQLSSPKGIFIDPSDNIYIADSGDNRVRVVNTSAQSVTIAGISIQPGDIATVAGTGTEGYTFSQDGGPATSATLSDPSGVFVDTNGDIFIGDTANFLIREVAGTTGIIASIAGNNTQGFSGDGGVATSGELNQSIGLYGDINGNLFIADTGNSRIRGLVATLAASKPSPQTVSPGGTATYSIQITGNPKYSVTLSCLQTSLPTNATCSFSPSTITPGPKAVTLALTITVPSAAASLRESVLRTGPLFYSFSLIPLAGILIAGLGVGDKRRHWLLLVGLGVFLLLLSACGGGGSSGTAPGGTTYNVQVQATTAAQANPVTITTAVLTVQ